MLSADAPKSSQALIKSPYLVGKDHPEACLSFVVYFGVILRKLKQFSGTQIFREINFRLKVLVISLEFSKELREVTTYPQFGNFPMIMLLMLQDG